MRLQAEKLFNSATPHNALFALLSGTVFFLLLLFTCPTWADQLIIEPDMGREPILNVINDTHHSLDLVMYGLTDDHLLNALIKQKMLIKQETKRETVRVILERHPYKAKDENNKTVRAFDKYHIAWHGSIPPFRLIHQKTLLVDDHKAMVMTFNFTHSTFKKERNFALVIDDPKRVREIESVFSADWDHRSLDNYSLDNYSRNLILSPDNSRKKLLSLIKNAKSTLKIYAQSINDYKIVGALAKAARKGVSVEILTSLKMREKQARYLTRAGVMIHYSKHLYIHAKVFIIDNQQAVLGSINLTRASLDDNRELSIITHDATVIKQLNTTFDHDWKSAHVWIRKYRRSFLNIIKVYYALLFQN